MDKILLLWSAISLVCLLAMMFLTSPADIGPLGILIFFGLLFFVFTGLAVFCCRLFFSIRGKINKAKAGNERKKSYYYGIVLALAPVILLICRSFGGLTMVEIASVAVLEIVLCFLVSRNAL
jgi:hypothetical protein